MYLAVIASLTLLLLAWHFLIQEEAQHQVTQQVQVWLQSMGAEASDIHFRMLRGTLSISNIKAEIQDGNLLIKHLFIKGNIASLSRDEPFLQQVVIQQARFEHDHLSQTWQNNTWVIPTALEAVLRHTKHLYIRQSELLYQPESAPITIHELHITGEAQQRQLTGHGYIQQQQQPWLLEGLFPTDLSQQNAHLSYTFDHFLHDIDWTGAWHSNNMQLNFKKTTLPTLTPNQLPVASLSLQLHQQQKQWQGQAQLQHWLLDTDEIKTRISGSADVVWAQNHWRWSSQQLLSTDTTLKHSQTYIKSMQLEGVRLDTAKQHLSMKKVAADQLRLSLDVRHHVNHQTAWVLDFPSIHVQALNLNIHLAEGEVKLHGLEGEASLKRQALSFDMRSQHQKPSWHLRKKAHASVVSVQSKNVPLNQMRALLPQPMLSQASQLEGLVSLNLKVNPQQTWAVTGGVTIQDMLMAWQNQQLETQKLALTLKQADVTGVQQATLKMLRWRLLLPLTPRQAWTASSHFDDWLQMPWSLQHIHLREGQVLIGQERHVLFEQADLKIQQWKGARPAQLQLSSDFGLGRLKVKARLQHTEQGMRWDNINIHAQDANMFALSDWLSLSGFTGVQQGHVSFDITVQRQQEDIQGKLTLTLQHLQLQEQTHEDGFFKQRLGYPIHRVLTEQNRVQLQTTFQGQGDWSMLLGQSLFTSIADYAAHQPIRLPHSQQQSEHLTSLSLHMKRKFSHNERKRLRDMLSDFKDKGYTYLTLVPDLGTAELSAALQDQVFLTQQKIIFFLRQQGMPSQQIYPVWAQAEHRSTGSAGAIHVIAIK